jgi:hypothetical protein
MNNYKHLKVFCSAMVLSVGLSFPTLAETSNHTMDFDSEYLAVAVMLSDYLIADYEVEDLVDLKDCKVKIYNDNNELVRFGKADDDLVVNLINKSDFLTQINETKYFKLNQ